MFELLAIAGSLTIFLSKKFGTVVVDELCDKLKDVISDKDDKGDKDDKEGTHDEHEKKRDTKKSSSADSRSVVQKNSVVSQMNLVHVVRQIDSGLLADKLTNALKFDFDTLHTQISGIQLAKLDSAFTFLRKSLLDFESFVRNSEQPVNEKEFDRAMHWIRLANSNATEAFSDKINVPIVARIQAMQLMLFCSALEYYNDQKKIISSLTMNIETYFKDHHISNMCKDGIKSTQARTVANPTFIQTRLIFGRLAVDVESITGSNSSLTKMAEDFLELLLKPPFVSTPSEQLTWNNAITFLSVPNSLEIPICIIKKAVSVCALPKHSYAKIFRESDHTYLSVVDVWTNGQFDATEVSVANNAKSPQTNVVYLVSKDLIMVYECCSRNIAYYTFDGKSVTVAENEKIQDLPEQLPKQLLESDTNSFGCIKVDDTGYIVCACEWSMTAKKSICYIWTSKERAWKEIVNYPQFHFLMCIKATEGGNFTAYLHDLENHNISLAIISGEGTYLSLATYGLRNSSWAQMLTSDQKNIFSFTNIFDRNGKWVHDDIDMSDAVTGKLIAIEKLPNSCRVAGICKIAGRIIVADCNM